VDLEGKSLVVIGGTSGVGLSAALAFVQAGASVVVSGRKRLGVESAARRLGSQAIAICADACDPATSMRAVAQAVNAFGHLDGLYHAAAGSGLPSGDGPIHSISDSQWRIILDLHLNAVMYSNRAAIRQFLQQRRGGSILNLGSVAGSAPAQRHFVSHAYAAAEAAVVGLSKAMAACYAQHSVRVNVLAPGLVDQPTLFIQHPSHDDALNHFIQTKQPLDGGRTAQPADFDAAAVYFMSDGSRFTTGQTLSVDGGWSVSEGQYETHL
jgi:NAD(P)-dependent dehydrogenase (short-subunit alcohol dehydrogenase family)